MYALTTMFRLLYSFCSLIGTDGCIDDALSGIASETATASVEADLHAIRKAVESTPGGFAMLNSTVKKHLAKWFEEKGAVKSAHRLKRRNSSLTQFSSEMSFPEELNCSGGPPSSSAGMHEYSEDTTNVNDSYLDVGHITLATKQGAYRKVSEQGSVEMDASVFATGLDYAEQTNEGTHDPLDAEQGSVAMDDTVFGFDHAVLTDKVTSDHANVLGVDYAESAATTL